MKTRLLILFLLVLPVMVQAQPGTLDKVGTAIRNNNPRVLGTHMDDNVEVTIMNKEGTYSRAQAVQIIKTFLTKAQPKSFKVIHRGSSGGGSKYAIGEMMTSRGKFRVYIYVKQKGPRNVVQEIRFEED